MRAIVKRLVGTAVAALIIGAIPLSAMAKEAEPARKLNPPTAGLALDSKSEYIEKRVVTPFTAKKPKGLLKQVTNGGYTFQMPKAWETPERMRIGDVTAMIKQTAAGGDSVSGVAFMTMEKKDSTSFEDVSLEEVRKAITEIGVEGKAEIRYVRAAIGKVAEVNVELQLYNEKAVERFYFPLNNTDWAIIAIQVGEDSAPTAMDTAAYMLYTLKKA